MRTAVPGLVLIAIAALGCPTAPDAPPEQVGGSGGDDDGPDPSEALYDPDHVVEVAIEMDPDEAAAMAAEENVMLELIEGEDCLDHPLGNAYTWYHADVVVDGVEALDVGIRKKGLIGSLSHDKPGLKLKFDKYVDGQELFGMERLTLNNSVSDPSLIRQCLGYQLFADAGLAASRCNFAHVVVNGVDLGVYVNVEPVAKDMLRRNYPDEDGDLYEGTLSDFREGWTGTFEPKTSDTDEALGPILAVTGALQGEDDALVAALDPHLDVDAFLTFWAMEVLVGHLDGYAGNNNNFLVYRDPTTGVLTFIPWGIDAILREFEAFGMEPGTAVLAHGYLPRRLFLHEPTRAQYQARLLALLDEVWDEDTLIAEIDRMEALVETAALPDPWRTAEIEGVRMYVHTRRAAVEAAVAAGLAWDEPLRDSPCLVDRGTLTASFETTWDTLATEDVLNTGWGQLSGTWDGAPLPTVTGGAIAGEDGGRAILGVVAMTGDTTAAEGAVVTDLGSIAPGDYYLDLGFRIGYYLTIDVAYQEEFQYQAYLVDGWIHIDEGSPSAGAPVVGTFDGRLMAPPE